MNTISKSFQKTKIRKSFSYPNIFLHFNRIKNTTKFAFTLLAYRLSNGRKVLRDCYLKIKKALAIRGLGSFMKNFGTSKV